MQPEWYIGSLMATPLASVSSARTEDMCHLSDRVTAAALRRVIIIP